jgi:hypothetical protein
MHLSIYFVEVIVFEGFVVLDAEGELDVAKEGVEIGFLGERSTRGCVATTAIIVGEDAEQAGLLGTVRLLGADGVVELGEQTHYQKEADSENYEQSGH